MQKTHNDWLRAGEYHNQPMVRPQAHQISDPIQRVWNKIVNSFMESTDPQNRRFPVTSITLGAHKSRL